jgi:predicted secreted hydrolase
MLSFPGDEGSHPEFRTEWWYATGWLDAEDARSLGFQITFFRTRPVDTDGNPSRFAPNEILIAHAALSDPRSGRLLSAERAARAGFGLANAAVGKTDVAIDDWSLRSEGDTLIAIAAGREFSYALRMRRTQPPLLNGVRGYSRKGPDPLAASYYYSLPQLAVDGMLTMNRRAGRVTGRAWLDHEWSTAYLAADAQGWDWMGINLDDGGALMAFRIRSRDGAALWAGATLRESGGATSSYGPKDVSWEPLRSWRSARSGASYPVQWRVRVGGLAIELEPLMDDQEEDARASSGALYWEGAVTARSGDRIAGHGYLELTGYQRALKL